MATAKDRMKSLSHHLILFLPYKVIMYKLLHEILFHHWNDPTLVGDLAAYASRVSRFLRAWSYTFVTNRLVKILQSNHVMKRTSFY